MKLFSLDLIRRPLERRRRAAMRQPAPAADMPILDESVFAPAEALDPSTLCTSAHALAVEVDRDAAQSLTVETRP